MPRITELHVNGDKRRIDANAERSLLSVLRDDLNLTGTKYGCGEGQCGACTVLIDGQARRSCLTSMGAIAGRQIQTIEGLESQGRLHPLQEAFLEVGALQCGYCTAGMIMSGVALLSKNPNPSPAEILRFMEGNICRCGTYSRIVSAIQRAARSKSGQAPSTQRMQPDPADNQSHEVSQAGGSSRG
ncbi:MAG: (2Fe-2S)-binding protein [Acidobacteria bacterium]|nr:(2Fe-2S)-binding protein [Acidobacteriota bacterium]